MTSILMLDDDPAVLSALRRTLRAPFAAEATIHAFTDPHAALERIGAERFDVILADYRMPTMDGLQFLRFARALQPEAQRIIVSAAAEIGAVMSAINGVEVFRCIVKPWTTEVLVDDLRAALRRAASMREERALERPRSKTSTPVLTQLEGI